MGLDIDFSKILQSAIQQAQKEVGTATLIVAGKSGVGKSTLINAVFKENLAETGHGRPITKYAREYSKQGFPVTIIDTMGLESNEDGAREAMQQLQTEIKRRNRDSDPNKHIHMAWICILEDARRIDDSDIELAKLFAENNIPSIAIITQSKADKGFRREVLEHLPQVANAISVLAEDIILDDTDIRIPAKNLDKLIDLTIEVAPEGQRNAITAANRVNLQKKWDRAHAAVASAAALAGGAGASPVPMTDAALIIPIQIGMLATISVIWGLSVDKVLLATIISGTTSGGIGTVAGRLLTANLLKLIPGAGSLVGGAINFLAAASITTVMGEAYIGALDRLTKDNPNHMPTAEEISREFQLNLKQSPTTAQ